MVWIARQLLVLAVALGACAAGVLNGRVLCVNGRGHCAIEDAHAGTGCPADHEHEALDELADQSERPDKCFDLSANVDLVRESAIAPFDVQSAQLAPFVYFIESLWIVAAPTARRLGGELWQHPPAGR